VLRFSLEGLEKLGIDAARKRTLAIRCSRELSFKTGYRNKVAVEPDPKLTAKLIACINETPAG
jgi:hypothetical protein